MSWGIGWSVSISFYIFLDVILLVGAVYQLWKLRSLYDNPIGVSYYRSRCKMHFYQCVSVLLLFRILFFIFWITLSVVTAPQICYVLLVVILAWCTLFFCITYATILLFWISFYMQMTDQFAAEIDNEWIIRMSQGAALIVLLSIFSVSVIFYALDLVVEFFWFQFGILLTISTVMTIEAVLFVFVGWKLYFSLSSSLSLSASQSLSPLQTFRNVNAKAREIICIASTVTVLFLFRAALLLYLAIEYMPIRNDPLSSNDWKDRLALYAAGWPFYVLYYLLGEDLPILMMMMFLSRIPVSVKQQMDSFHNKISPPSLINSFDAEKHVNSEPTESDAISQIPFTVYSSLETDMSLGERRSIES